MLTPAVVHALVAAGATAAMLAAAFEADYRERQTLAVDALDGSRSPSALTTRHPAQAAGTGCEGSSTQSEAVEALGGQKINPPRFDEAGVGQRRADGVDGVVGDLSSSGTLPLSSLSLSKEPLSCLAVDSGNSGDRPFPLPAGFRPDSKTKAYVIKQMGEAQAEAIIASFCDYFWSRPVEMETAGGWNQRLRSWALRERGWQRGPPQLALMRPLDGERRRRESG